MSLRAALVVGLFCFSSCKEESKPSAAAPEGTPYDVSLTARGASAATATVKARDGFHVNADYPVAFKPAADATVKFASEKLALGAGTRTPCPAPHETDACQADFEVPFTTDAVGPQQVKGTLLFSVCRADKCLVEKVPLTLAMEVK